MYVQCGQPSTFFIITANGVQLDFVAFGITLVCPHELKSCNGLE